VGTKHLAARSRFMASNSQRQCVNHLGTAFAIHIGAYCGGAGCLTLILIFLHQPAHSPNPGMAVYKPPPGTVITYLPPSRQGSLVPAAFPPAIAAEPETTGRAAEEPVGQRDAQSMPEPRPNAVLSRKPKPPKDLRRETKADLPQPTPCIPGYDGSGAQTRWC
jgi:hypothetical protein